MKKITTILLIFAIILSHFVFVGCGFWNHIINSTATTPTSTRSTTTTSTTSTTTSTTTTTITTPTTSTTSTTSTTTSTTTTATTSEPNYDDIVWEEKKYWNGDISADFVPGQLMVLLDEAISYPQKVHSPEFFVGVEIVEIIDCKPYTTPETMGPHYNQSLLLILSDKYNTKEATLEAMHILEPIVGIVVVEPNLILSWDTVANDPYYSYANDETDQWALDAIDAPLAWDFVTGADEVRIGVVDTGIASHPDLNGNYDISDALDFYDVSTVVPSIGKADTDSHGTHVAGIIGAVGNNGVGVSGVNWDVSLVQMRSVGISTNDAIVNAIDWASSLWNTDDRISILNFSAGAYFSMDNVESAIRNYCEKGGLFICSTGNKEQDNDLYGQHHYPSFYAPELFDS